MKPTTIMIQLRKKALMLSYTDLTLLQTWESFVKHYKLTRYIDKKGE